MAVQLLGMPFELLKFDSKLSAQESQSALKAAIDQGARVILTGGSGSSVVASLVGAVNKHNERNPEQRVLVLNHSSIDPDMTGKNCSFWYFQTEASTAMKMQAIANYIKTQDGIKKIYLLNQDYAHGRQWASYGRQMVAAVRPDIAFVGEDFHANRPRERFRALRCQDPGNRGRLGDHRQLGAGHDVAAARGRVTRATHCAISTTVRAQSPARCLRCRRRRWAI